MITTTTQPRPQSSEFELLVKILEVLNNQGSGSGGGATFSPTINSPSDLQALPTASGAEAIGVVIPTMNTPSVGKLGYYQLQSGGGGDYRPNDYNSTSNNVSWVSVL